MKLLFFGSGSFGLPTLEALCEQHDVVGVITQPDRPAGRKRQLTATPIGQWAEQRGLAVHKSEDVNADEFVEQIAAYQADASVVIAFGQKLSPALIDAMGSLAVNLHGSLLPAYRGAAPIQRAMMDGLTTTGVSVIALAQRMDAGEVYGEASLAIDPQETAGELHDRLSLLGPEAVGKVLDDLQAGSLRPLVQDESLATRAPKLAKADGTVDFNQPAHLVRARVHGLTPWPGCRVGWVKANNPEAEPSPLILLRIAEAPDLSCFLPSTIDRPWPGEVLENLTIATAQQNAVKLLKVQTPGKKPMAFEDFVRGYGFAPGDRLQPWA